MGLFSYFRCLYPLPLKGANKLQYQTKDIIPNFMDYYEVRENGTLWKEEYDIEDRSNPKAKGLMRMVGCMTRVNKRWKRHYFSGFINFYTCIRDINNEKKGGRWIEWCAEFKKGKLITVKRIKNNR